MFILQQRQSTVSAPTSFISEAKDDQVETSAVKREMFCSYQMILRCFFFSILNSKMQSENEC